MTIDGSSDNERSQVYELVMPKGSSLVTLYQTFREGVPEDENAGAHKASLVRGMKMVRITGAN